MHDDLFDFFYEALPGYEQVGLRRTLLGGGGSFQDPGVCNFIQRHDPVGPGDVRHPRRGHRREAGHQRPGGHQPWNPDPARLVVLRRLGGSGDVRHQGPARQPGRPAAPRNQHTNPRPQKRDLDGKYSWVMSPRWFDGHRPSSAGHRRRPHRPTLGHGARRPGRRGRLREGDRPTACRSTCRRPHSSPRSASSGRPCIWFEHHRTWAGPGPTSRRTRLPARCTSRRKHWRRSAPVAPRPGKSSRRPTKASAAALPKPYAAFSATTW